MLGKILIALAVAAPFAVYLYIRRLRTKAAQARARAIIVENREATKNQTDDEAWDEFNKHN